MTLVEIVAIALQAGINVFLWGEPGVGKTSAFGALARSFGMSLWPRDHRPGQRAYIPIIASLRDPTDFAGLPVLTPAGVKLEAPTWARIAAEVGPCWILFDEMSTAPPAVQAALLRVIAEKVVGEVHLHPQTAVMAAANPIETAANGFELPAAAANRWCHLDWEVNAVDVANGFTSGWPDPVARVLPADWERYIGPSRAIIAAFLRHVPSSVLRVPDNERDKGRAWPSPRTWDYTARAMAACTATGAPEDAFAKLAQGLVGEGACVEFLSWRRTQNLQDPEMLLANPNAYRHPERADAALATLEGVAAAALAHPRSAQRWLAAWHVLDRAAEKQLDIAWPPSRVLAREDKEQRVPIEWGDTGVTAIPRFALQRFRGLVEAAQQLERGV